MARTVGGIALAATFAMALPVSPASAQGMFDFLFGGPRRQAQPPSASSYADPYGSRPADQIPRVDAGPAVAFCVRLCDGRYFPIQRSTGADAAQVCSAFCPAARTKIFSGGAIDYAVARDGARYKDLPSAFAYRKAAVANCTCNGKDPYGLVTADANNDPTLRPGDIVATEQGFVAYSGGRRSADFTPIDAHAGLSKELRQRLKAARIVPRNATPAPAPDVTASTGDRRVQVDR